MSGHGELWGRSPNWWGSKPLVRVDARRLVVADTPVQQKVLDAYRADPLRASSDGNDPCVEATRDGRLVVHDGKHRALAARAEGRVLWVRMAHARGEASR